MEKIFVSIASLKDSELIPTIKDALDRAIHPERIHFGVFLQDVEENRNILAGIPNCKVIFINYLESKGPGYARNRIAKELFDNEDYFLQIDSHSRFLEGWDSLLIKTFKKLDGKVCLTGFPDKYYPNQSYHEYASVCNNSQSTIKSIDNNYLVTGEDRTAFSSDYYSTIAVSAAFVFSNTDFVKSITHDFEDVWIDQEIVSCLGYINGYDFYVPNINFVFHFYADTPHWQKTKFHFGHLSKDIKNPDIIHKLKDFKADRTFDDWVNRINEDIKKTNRKYISFEPWMGGFSNIRQTYETIGALSIITGRTIILPPKIYCLFFSTAAGYKDTYIDMFDALDKDAFMKEFDCVDYYDVPEYTTLENSSGYFNNVHTVADCIEFNFEGKLDRDPQDKFVMHYGINKSNDFKYFTKDRNLIDLKSYDNSKFIHFPQNLFTQFYYHIYANLNTRNLIREKVKNGVKFKQRFFDLADSVKEKIGNYNAIHIRRNDFLKAHPTDVEFQLDDLLDNIKDKINYDLPLYIATDEKDKTLFYFLRDYYQLKFLDNFHKDLSDFDSMIVEQIICAKAENFLGSNKSTYTFYIHQMRAYIGKKDYHRVGTNYDYGELKYNYFPWLTESWNWHTLNDFAWKIEEPIEYSNYNLGVYSSHNSAIAVSKDSEILEVVEYERWIGKKNSAFDWYLAEPREIADNDIKDILKYFKKKYNIDEFNELYFNATADYQLDLYNVSMNQHVPHHEAHSANALYQSPYDKALIISFDGGSEHGHFKIYLGEKGKPFKNIHDGQRNFPVAYQTVANFVEDIKKEKDIYAGNLVYSGKIMGLSSYGNLDDELLKKMRLYYQRHIGWGLPESLDLFKEIFDIKDGEQFEKQMGRDIARCNQYIFEELLNNEIQPFIDYYVKDDVKLIFTGGGAMNVINNAKYDAFVSPNCDDRGMALGCLLWGLRPEKILDATYIASEPYDELPEHEPYSIQQALDGLIDGKIFGLIQGRGEHGARALGNRSIICLPKKGMKEILNDKVKHREPFRPFAPMCTLEDASTYFEFGKHSRWMTHNAKVKGGFEEELGAIIHVDGTARLQTVTKSQNEYIYNLLVGLKERGFPPVLLNTSFNIQGKPILNTYKDAIWMRENTGLDEVITDKFILK